MKYKLITIFYIALNCTKKINDLQQVKPLNLFLLSVNYFNFLVNIEINNFLYGK